MSNILTPINPSVSRTVHKEEKPKDVSAWFETETLEINFGETTGRPSSDITFRSDYLAQFLQTGWKIDAVLNRSESGVWVNSGGSTTYYKSQAYTPDYQNSSNASSNFSGLEHDLYYQTSGIGQVHARTAGFENISPSPVTVTQSTNVPSADAPAYWAAYQRVRLIRRRLVAERVMQSMMDSFTTAYNGGRGIEDSRINDIVSLYTIMLSRSEQEGNAIVNEATDLLPLANQIVENVMASVAEADAASSEVSESSTKNRERDVNRQFDTLVATTKAQMITNGTYNSTLWPSVAAGIERQRSEALDKAKESGMSVKLNAKSSVATLKSTLGAQVLSSMQGIVTSNDQRKLTVVEMRNTVLKWMLDYIGTREESYPELEEIATVAERMGFSVGSAGSIL